MLTLYLGAEAKKIRTTYEVSISSLTILFIESRLNLATHSSFNYLYYLFTLCRSQYAQFIATIMNILFTVSPRIHELKNVIVNLCSDKIVFSLNFV